MRDRVTHPDDAIPANALGVGHNLLAPGYTTEKVVLRTVKQLFDRPDGAAQLRRPKFPWITKEAILQSMFHALPDSRWSSRLAFDRRNNRVPFDV